MSFFPHHFEHQIEGEVFTSEEVWHFLNDKISDERAEKFSRVASTRTYQVTPVLEDVDDLGNVNAVLRTSECLGIGPINVIRGNRIKRGTRVSQGSEKWLDISKWQDTSECLNDLKSKGYQVVATALDPKAISFFDLDFSKPIALCLGNEKDGVSETLKTQADQVCYYPSVGFSQSFNISVAAAVMLSHIMFKRGGIGRLSEVEQLILKAEYCLRHVHKAKEQLLLSRKGE